MDLKETDILGSDVEQHWYYVSKAKAMSRFLQDYCPENILDVGAGSGYFSRSLLKSACAREAWCVDVCYPSEYDVVESGKLVHYRSSVGKMDVDLVLLMDVLEHVEDDVSLLKEYVEKVNSGTVFLVTVPAFEFLWSGHDTYLGHKRRYKIDSLKKTVLTAGLDILDTNYFFGGVFPIAAISRIYEKIYKKDIAPRSQLKKHHPLVNIILKKICDFELIFMRYNKYAGLSVFCLAVKR